MFAETSEMFLGLLNRVKFDLVRTHLQCIIRNSINRKRRPMEEADQVFALL